MGMAAEIISGRVTNPGAAFTPITLDTGDSLTVRAVPQDSAAYLDDVWALGATAGIVRIRSPRMHDNVQGQRMRYTAATPTPLQPFEASERLYPQDVLIVEETGGAAEVDVVSMLLWYGNVPGIDARLVNYSEVDPRIKNILTVETTHATGATVGDYGGALAINANIDLLKANTDYAILGYLTDVNVCSVGYRGPDTGNVRIGGPGTTLRHETRDWFVKLSQRTGRPYVPIINSANKAGTTIDLVHTAAAAAVNVTTILAELGS